MKKSIQLYIGENNSTRELETEKITATCALFFEGFTIQQGTGFWRGAQEKTAIVSIYDDEKKIMQCIDVLKKALKQDAIAMQELKPLKFI